ncbi:MAG: hypothetical protein JRD00_01745, partial [Deltaproteobacteria bacterium]|nr:hypothetical protein [Deltaproteobacteria bacterium]
MTRRPCIGKIVLLFASIAILLPHMVSDVTAGQASGIRLGEYKALKEAGSIAGAGKIRSSLRAVMNKMEARGITRQNARELGASTLSNPLVRVSDDGSIHAYIHVHTFGVEEEALLEQYGAVIEITNEKLG